MIILIIQMNLIILISLIFFSGIIKLMGNIMTHDYSRLFLLLRKGIIRMFGNNEQNWLIGAWVPTCEFCSLFSIVLHYSDYA